MKISIATFFLILPFAYGFEFASAKDINLCGRLFNIGSGFGRVEFSTHSASCIGEKRMWFACMYTRPHNTGEFIPHERDCEGDESCVPHDESIAPLADAGCIVLHSPSGVKGSGDTDNHACSSGIRIGNDDIFVLSSISPDSIEYGYGIKTCIISRSGSNAIKDRVFSGSPCPKTSRILKLAKRTTYQACITTAVALAKTSVGFHWNIRGPGKAFHPNPRRGLEQAGKPLSEMFTIVGNNTANDALRIVIGDREIGDQD
ncbi:hypothetical protein Vi05172_g5361 [Venturia inaequalis]|nr:hypothetical protein Vi05172_g5361 [Venturia inaequalis]